MSDKPWAERPIMMIRLRSGHERPEVWERLLPVLKANRAACDEVWFATGIGMIPIEEHRKLSAKMAKWAEQLRKTGIVPSLQIQSTLGHGDYIGGAVDNSGKNWGGFVGRQGEECRFCSCPRQEGLLEYFRQLAEIYAQWQPGSVWIDDDLRLDNHDPAIESDGCYCPHCLALFSRQIGVEYTRESLVAACDADPELKTAWQKFGSDGICRLAATIAETFRKHSPSTRLGYQHGLCYPRQEVLQTLCDASGKRVASRPGGGAYCDHAPYDFILKGILESAQIFSQPGYDTVDQVCAEVETYPRVFACRTGHGLQLESMVSLAMGMDSLSYFVMDPDYETPEWYGQNLLSRLAAAAPLIKEIAKANEGTLPSGIGFFADRGFKVDVMQTNQLPLGGIPCAACSPAALGRMMDAAAVNAMTDNELTAILRQGNLVFNGDAVMAIQDRGMSHLIGGLQGSILDEPVFEFFTADPVNRHISAKLSFPGSWHRIKLEYPADAQVRVAGEYRDNQGNPLGAASVMLTCDDGRRFVALGYDGFFTDRASTSKLRSLYGMMDWLTGEKLPVLPAEPVQCLIVPRVDGAGLLKSVFVVNTTIDSQRHFELKLRNLPPDAYTAKWSVPEEEPLYLPIDPNTNTVTLPKLAPWTAAWLTILP